MVDKRTGDAVPPAVDGAHSRWALGSGGDAYFMLSGKAKRLPVLVELNGITIEEFSSGEKLFDDKALLAAWRSAVNVSPLFDEPFGPLKRAGFVTALVSEEFFRLRSDPKNVALRRAVPWVSLGPPLDEGRLSAIPGSQPGTTPGGAVAPKTPGAAPGGAKGSAPTATASGAAPGAAIVAIIDDGIAFANERFRNGDKTRFEFLWIQDGVPPSTILPFGRELQADSGGPLNDINALFGSCSFAGQIDEDEVYLRSRVVDYGQPGHKSLAFSASHGTAVADTATGDPAGAGRDDRPIIAVQLPSGSVQDTSLNGLEPFIFAAFYYVLWRSLAVSTKRGGPPLPIVINLSFGNIAGPHDGTSLIERAIDQLVELWRNAVGPIEVVLPSGNSYLARCHAQFEFASPALSSASGNTITLPWRVLPDDRTPSYMQIWLPYQPPPAGNDRVRLRVIAPGGTAPANATPWLGETGSGSVRYPATGKAWCEVYYTFMPLPTARGVFEIFLQPTASLDFDSSGPTVPIAPAGVWSVEIENFRLGPGDIVEAWIQRDDTPFNYPRLGRQSYFDAACYAEFDDGGRAIETDDANCLVKRAGTINAIATGRQPAVIGGVLRSELRPAKYSAGGPVTKPATGPITRSGPDALAVSDDSIVHQGVLAAGTRSGSAFAFSGTSIAAPRIARWIAGQLATGNSGGRGAVQGLAAKFESGPPPLPNKPPLDRGGTGRILLDPVYAIARFWPWP